MAFAVYSKGKDLWVGQFSVFPNNLVKHGVSTRFGGVSQKPYDSLNLALHVGDDPAAVLENRRLFCAAVGVPADRICTPEQVHGSRIYLVKEEDAGRGACSYDDAVKGTDALITNVPGLPLLLCFADCTPIMLADPVRRIVAVAHGGWKGTLKNIAAETVQAMEREYGSKPADCIAAIGPAIGAECYEVGTEVMQAFQEAYSKLPEGIFRPGQEAGRYLLDLPRMNRWQLESTGLLPERIDSAEVCTCCSDKMFYSYRASGGTTGRIAAVMALC